MQMQDVPFDAMFVGLETGCVRCSIKTLHRLAGLSSIFSCVHISQGLWLLVVLQKKKKIYGEILLNKTIILYAALRIDLIIQLWLFQTDITTHLSPAVHTSGNILCVVTL